MTLHTWDPHSSSSPSVPSCKLVTFTSSISDILLFLLFFSACLLLYLLPALKQHPPTTILVSKNNVRFVSRNPWYVLATRLKNSAFSPCPTEPTHPVQTHTHCKASSLCSPLFVYSSSISYLPLFLSFSPSRSLPLECRCRSPSYSESSPRN